MGQLIVVRHGQASIMSTDYDKLSERGHEQGRQLGREWVAHGERFDAVYSGPARRHVGTATEVAHVYTEQGHALPKATVLPGLDEHDAFGLVTQGAELLRDNPDIRGLHTALTEATTPKDRSVGFQRIFEAVMLRWLTGDVNPEGIETWPVFRERVDAAVQEMLSAVSGYGQRVVVFTSVGPLAVMLMRALGTTAARSFETAWRIRNASVTTFVFGRGRGRLTLDSFNGVGHLPDPAMHTFR